MGSAPISRAKVFASVLDTESSRVYGIRNWYTFGMKKFKLGLIITGIGLLSSSLFLVPKNFLGNSFGLIPFLGVLLFILGTLILSASYGGKLSHWLSALVVLSILFLVIPWGGDYTPVDVARMLYLLFGASSIGSWLYLMYIYNSCFNIIH